MNTLVTLAEVLEKGGHSHTVGLTKTDGWMVGITGWEFILPISDVTDQHILDYFTNTLIYRKAHDNLYMGIWVDDGYLYFDLSQWVETEEGAHALGKFHNQLAVYNLGTQETEQI
jgi:hypothetical protein